MCLVYASRADPWVIQRMVENHALALLHLEDLLLDFDEVLATGEPVDDAKTSRELQMHYNILFACDYTPKVANIIANYPKPFR